MTKDEFKTLIASFNEKHQFALILFNIQPLTVDEYNAIEITYVSDITYMFEDLMRLLKSMTNCIIVKFVKDGRTFITFK